MPKDEIVKKNTSTPNAGQIDAWFEGIIDHIRSDHFMYTNNVATAEKKDFYDDLFFGDGENLVREMRETSSKFYIKAILRDYLRELKSTKKKPLKLAMALSDSKILVWAVIEDNDEDTENALLISEAKVNGKYYEKGFYLNSTITEKSDSLLTPGHYQQIIE